MRPISIHRTRRVVENPLWNLTGLSPDARTHGPVQRPVLRQIDAALLCLDRTHEQLQLRVESAFLSASDPSHCANLN
jgi:hypothetical protein